METGRGAIPSFSTKMDGGHGNADWFVDFTLVKPTRIRPREAVVAPLGATRHRRVRGLAESSNADSRSACHDLDPTWTKPRMTPSCLVEVIRQPGCVRDEVGSLEQS